ncbi:DUF1240 domain-containing protein [Xenorhabdus littoralis]|uniref:DUF1240 domain-containing protein n=1 Tax=Xenorhabdus littoralis TaxID=2582835 RepID=UPI0029E7F929|nr:DUF1240 domain-containing protein [Xenorhabdus sp. psl]MDX7990122.1 DUF1240 domain-containing protein [Xenorhabdus sp. psl]
MVNNKIRLLCALSLLPILIFCMYVVITYFLSLIFMEEEITFSAGVFIAFFSSPLVLFGILGAIYFIFTKKKPKYYDLIIKVTWWIFLSSLVLSMPVSFYVGYKLQNNGYLTCDKISWMSPTTYVKDIKLCN